MKDIEIELESIYRLSSFYNRYKKITRSNNNIFYQESTFNSAATDGWFKDKKHRVDQVKNNFYFSALMLLNRHIFYKSSKIQD